VRSKKYWLSDLIRRDISSRHQAAALWAQAYTPDGLTQSVTDANGHATGYAYDGLDRLGTSTWPDASTEVLAWDADSNVLSRKTRKGDTVTLTYDTLNRLASKAAPAEATVSLSYDLAGRLIAASDTSAAVVAPAASASYAASYSYDALNRTVGASWSSAPAQATSTATSVSFTHAYDATNRRIGQTASDNGWWSYPTTATSVSYTANSLNQYSAVGGASPSYDGDRNLTFDGTFTYAYDAEGRLTAISQGATAIGAYAYDAGGRRKSKTAGGATTMFVTDADGREVLEYDGTSGALSAWYAYGPGPNAVLNRMNVTAASRQTLIPDIQGSIIGVLDSASGALTKAGYQPFGENPTTTTGGFRYAGPAAGSGDGGERGAAERALRLPRAGVLAGLGAVFAAGPDRVCGRGEFVCVCGKRSAQSRRSVRTDARQSARTGGMRLGLVQWRVVQRGGAICGQ
jgi:YD repeat-containing protein